MIPASSSLLAFLEAPVVVGDPDGKTVYVNSAFEVIFRTSASDARGSPLAMLFEGGGREAVLESVARVCETGASVRFRVRERGIGFSALASPISVEGARVGVVLLLLEEALQDERLLAFHREIREPLDALVRCFEELLEQTGGRRAARFRDQVEAGMKALQRVRRWSDELQAVVTGRPPAAPGRRAFDPVQAVRGALASVTPEAPAARRPIDLLLPAQLPAVMGDGDRFEAAFASLLRDRLQRSAAPSFALTAKAVGQGERAAVLVSLTESPVSEGASETPEADEAPALVTQILTSLGASLHTTDDPVLGRTTAIRLRVAA